jgi:hypothetical protein
MPMRGSDRTMMIAFTSRALTHVIADRGANPEDIGRNLRNFMDSLYSLAADGQHSIDHGHPLGRFSLR